MKTLLVPASDMTIWHAYPATWFAEGVEFLDAGAAEARDAPAPTAAAIRQHRCRRQLNVRCRVCRCCPTAMPSGATPAPAAASDDTDRKAASALSLAKNYINAAQYETARKKLQALIQTYPKSASTPEAKALLDEIKDK